MSSYFRRCATVTGLSLALLLDAGCPKPRPIPHPHHSPRPVLYVANSTPPAIQMFTANLGAAFNLPQLLPLAPWPMADVPMALNIVGNTLYAALGNGQIAQFAIDPSTGYLTERGTIAAGKPGGPPYVMAARGTGLFVANLGSNNVSVFSIDATGNLAITQILPVLSVSSLGMDDSGKFVYIASRRNGGIGPEVCSHAIQADGTLTTGRNCVAVNGEPWAMSFARGVLFLLLRGTTGTYLVSAFRVDPATGTLLPRGQDLDVGAADASGLSVSLDGRFLFLPRHGGFQTIGTADPLQIVANATTTNTGQSCFWPPAAPGNVLVDPRGRAIFVSDQFNLQGQPALLSLGIDPGGSVSFSNCLSVGGFPGAMAIFIP